MGSTNLDIISLMVIAGLAEQSVMNNVVNVQLIEEGIAVLRNRSGEDDNLVQLADPLHELIDSWPFDDINIMVLTFDLDRNCEIGLVEDLETTVNQCLVQVEN